MNLDHTLPSTTQVDSEAVMPPGDSGTNNPNGKNGYDNGTSKYAHTSSLSMVAWLMRLQYPNRRS